MIIRFFKWWLNFLGLKNLIGFSLLMLAFGSAAYVFGDIVQELEPGFFLIVSFYALSLSWLFARSNVPGWFAAVSQMLLGIIILFIIVGDLAVPLVALIRTSFSTTWEILNLVPDDAIDLSNLQFSYAEVYYGISGLLNAISNWASSLIEGFPLFNEAAIALLWGFLMWVLAVWGGWSLRRYYKPLLSVLPVGILLTGVMAYTWSGTSALAPFVFSTLLLVALVNFDRSEVNWIARKMDYPEDLPREFMITSTVIIAGITVIAIMVPAISFQRIVDLARQFTSPQIDEAEPVIQSFGLEQSSAPREDIGTALRGGFPRGHLMGSGPELSEQVVMTVKITGGVPRSNSDALNLPLYWRSLTYDEYFGFGWRSSDIILRTYPAGEEILEKSSSYYQAIQQDVRMAQGKTRFLYAAGEILSSDDEFKIAYRPTPRYTEIFDAHGDFFGASIDTSSYRVQSLIPVVSEADLRNARGEIPNWIMERYLFLPESIPSRVFKLAEELTQDDSTSYDKAQTLEAYLRGFEYTLDVDLPPLKSDMVDYFLFDLKKGYCDYYATTMAVMVRHLGIPARLAIGYSRGSYDEVNNRYIVTEADAHSWVEIYFSGIGWVPFEPTAGRLEIDRLESSLEIPVSLDETQPLDTLVPWTARLDWNWTLTVLSILAGISTLFLGYLIFDHIRIHNLSPTGAISSIYQRLYRHGCGLGLTVEKETTPLEFSRALMALIQELAQESIFAKPLSKAIAQISEFTTLYTLMLYSPLTISMDDRSQVIKLWRQLRRRLLIARLRQITQRSSSFNLR